MEEHAFSFADCADFLHWVNGTDFIVGSHDTDKDSFVGDGIGNLLRRNEPELINGQESNFAAIAFEAHARVDNCLVFG